MYMYIVVILDLHAHIAAGAYAPDNSYYDIHDIVHNYACLIIYIRIFWGADSQHSANGRT